MAEIFSRWLDGWNFCAHKCVYQFIPNDNIVDMDRPNCDETREREKEEKERNSYRRKDKYEYVVTNLSSRKLSEAEHDLLSKGLSFIPTQHNIDIWKVQSELAEWERRMRLREYFAGQNDESDEEEEEDDTGIAAALGRECKPMPCKQLRNLSYYQIWYRNSGN